MHEDTLILTQLFGGGEINFITLNVCTACQVVLDIRDVKVQKTTYF